MPHNNEKTNQPNNTNNNATETGANKPQDPPVLSKTVTKTQAQTSSTNTKPNTKTDKKSTPEKKEPKVKQKSVKTGRSAWLALLVALCAIFGTGYIYWDIQQYRPLAHQQIQDQLQLVETQITERMLKQVSNDSTANQQHITQLKEQITGQQHLIEELSTRLLSTRRQIGEITHVSRQSWLLAETEYLLRLANQRLMTEQTTTGALALLRSADDIIVDLDETGLYTVRTAIAKEIAAMQALGETDIEGYFLRLSALFDQIKKMNLLQPIVQKAPNIGELNLSDHNYTETFNILIDKLLGLVRISQRDEPIKPLLLPRQHYYVQQNLRLILEQAQLALLQRRPALYEKSLDQAALWITDYFQLNNTSTSLLNSIEQLRKIDIAPKMPDISGSLKLLKTYLNTRIDQKISAPLLDQTIKDI